MISPRNIVMVLALIFVNSACSHLDTEHLKQTTDYSVEHVGTATVILKYGDLTIVTDPAFDQAGQTYDLGFATLEKTENSRITADEVRDVDLVLLSHDQHADNLDTSGREFLKSVELTITTKEGADRLGPGTVGLESWGFYKIGDVKITAVPAQHGPEQAIPVIGTTTGFIVSSEAGPTVYISGDTVPFSGTNELIKRYAGKIDYALLHAGSVAQGEKELTYFTMTANDAVTLADRLGAKKFSIIHADSWSHFRELLPAAMSVLNSSKISDRVIDLQNGNKYSIE